MLVLLVHYTRSRLKFINHTQEWILRQYLQSSETLFLKLNIRDVTFHRLVAKQVSVWSRTQILTFNHN